MWCGSTCSSFPPFIGRHWHGKWRTFAGRALCWGRIGEKATIDHVFTNAFRQALGVVIALLPPCLVLAMSLKFAQKPINAERGRPGNDCRYKYPANSYSPIIGQKPKPEKEGKKSQRKSPSILRTDSHAYGGNRTMQEAISRLNVDRWKDNLGEKSSHFHI